MKTRPQLKVGDIVKWHQNVVKHSPHYKGHVFIIKSIWGDGIDGHCQVEMIKKDEWYTYSAIRKELWYTGVNIRDYNKGNSGNSAFLREKEIEDLLNGSNLVYEKADTNQTNDGKEYCFKCNTKTKVVETGFVKKYNICPKCKI
jgi:hypothetical protein